MFVFSYVPSQADVVVFQAITSAPSAKHPHALRWFNHVKSYQAQFARYNTALYFIGL